jgi:hypothetical protein
VTRAGGVRTAIRRGVAFIATRQAKNGSFSSASSPTHTPFIKAATYHTTFVPALLLAALSEVNDPPSRAICSKLAAWLQAQKSDNGAYNYWAKGAVERRTLPYPDDLDDSFCALIALYTYDPTLIDGACLGQAVKLLLTSETHVGGPYRTWLVPKDSDRAWLDVDLAVNTNVAAFLRLVAEPTPALVALMEQAITTSTFASPYYPSPYPLLYYLARAYRGAKQQLLVERILQAAKNGAWETPLQTALAVCALIRLGDANDATLTAAIGYLVDKQQLDGSWPAEAFCIDPAKKGKPHYHGAAALTTAFALEALAGYNKLEAKRIKPNEVKKETTQALKLHARVLAIAKRDTQQLTPTLRSQVLRTIQQTASTRSGHEIIVLAYEFGQSLRMVLARDSAAYECLGLANLYGWTAYTIYDDFLDGEGDPSLLSVANITHRLSLNNFENALPDNKAYHAYVRQTFNGIDAANAWEIANCRFIARDDILRIGKMPQYGDLQRLATRSAGHALGPMGLLLAQKIMLDTPSAQHIEQALHHYLIARQLSDDIHDWEQDTRAGHCTYVVGLILQQLGYSGRLPFTTLLPAMRHHFWHYTLADVCDTITKHTGLARTSAMQSGLLQTDNYLNTLCNRIDEATTKTLQEQTTAKQFLTAYQAD